MGAISTHGEAKKKKLEFIGGDKDRQLKHLWEGTRIGDNLAWDEIEDEAKNLLERVRDNRQASDDSHVSKE
jgi:ribosomal protein S28E/S33